MTIPDDSIRRLYDMVNGPEFLDVYAKIHARAIHIRANTPEDLRPRINEAVPEQARILAYESLVPALRYLAENDANDNSDHVLRYAAQLLEKLYVDAPESSERLRGLIDAAIAYYLAGDYPRAFVIVRGIECEGTEPTVLAQLMLRREIETLERLTLENICMPVYADRYLAEGVSTGELGWTHAVEHVLAGTVNRAYALAVQYARSGSEDYITRAVDLCHVGRQLAVDVPFLPWWWVFQCTLMILREFERNSLWTSLKPLRDTDPTGMTERYIRSAITKRPQPVLELWRSQAKAVARLSEQGSYCIKMPTGAGKTRIAELAILKFLMDTYTEPDKKCLYVAPFRALAAELEATLAESFRSLGVRVSQLYGGYEVGPGDSLLTKEARVLIATPEKFDAILRYKPEIQQQISLIVVDEGHIIDSRGAGHPRGLRYELFIERIVNRFERKGVRVLCISAVMPNVEQFTRWITGKSATEGLLESDWRPTQQLIGVLSWNGISARIDYTHRNKQPVTQDFFIPHYFEALASEELKAAKCSTRRFPGKTPSHSKLLALAAVRAASEGATLVFAPMVRYVESVAESLISLVDLYRMLYKYKEIEGSVLPILSDAGSLSRFRNCRRHAAESTGESSIVVRALDHGFVVHHASVPRDIRVELESLVRDGILRVVVATHTLAQGVNLPVKTVLIHSLLQGHNEPVSGRDFWNICGRAGRAGHETEGNIFILANPNLKSEIAVNRVRTEIDRYVRLYAAEVVESAVRKLLERVVVDLRMRFESLRAVDVAALCEHLGDDDPRWDSLDGSIQSQLDVLDTQLLALIEENRVGLVDISTVAELFKDSLIRIQLSSAPGFLSEADAMALITTRLRRVLRVCGTPERRHRFYTMGLSIKDCAAIEESFQDIRNDLIKAQDYLNWDASERAEYLVTFCSAHLLKLSGVRDVGEQRDLPSFWPEVLRAWILGGSAEEIVRELELGSLWTPMKISSLIDDLCEYRLPWGLNAITAFYSHSKDAGGETETPPEALPPVVDYFPSMLRFGTHSPIAAILMSFGLKRRAVAARLADSYEGEVEVSEVIVWFRSQTPESIAACLNDDDAKTSAMELVEHLRQPEHTRGDARKAEWKSRIRIDEPSRLITLREGTDLIGMPAGVQLRLFTPALEYLTSVEIPDGELANKVVRASIQRLEPHAQGIDLEIVFSSG